MQAKAAKHGFVICCRSGATRVLMVSPKAHITTRELIQKASFWEMLKEIHATIPFDRIKINFGLWRLQPPSVTIRMKESVMATLATM